MHRRTVAFLGASLAVAVAAGADADIVLTDVTVEAGLDVWHDPAEACIGPEYWMTGGMAVGDFDSDGWQDLFFIGGGQTPDRLFINNGDGTFTDRAAEWGLDTLHGGSGASVADFNNDGWLDVYVTSFGDAQQEGVPGNHLLFRNHAIPGTGGFTNVAPQAGVNYSSPVTATGYGSAHGDYDLDGDLDLFVASWTELGEGNRLYRNEGDGTFTDVTAAALGTAVDNVWGFQPAFADMDGDGWPEILLAADFETSRYLINNRDGTFTDFTVPSGTGLDDNGMGQTVGDINNDGLFDWYVTSIYEVGQPNPGNMLYLNLGGHQYVEISVPAGVNDGGFGWGTIAVDLDADGLLDLVEVNGAAHRPWLTEAARLYRNVSTDPPAFVDVAVAAGLDSSGQGKSVVRLDYDNDGDQDIAIGNNDGPLQLFRNDSDGGAWLRLLFNTNGNPLIAPHGFGAKVTVTAGGESWIRYVNGCPSYLATSEMTAHFGLGDVAVIDELRIDWPRGYTTVFENHPVNMHRMIFAPALTDLDGDGATGINDFLLLLGDWGEVEGVPQLRSDFDNDGTVGINDFLVLLGAWS